MTENILRNIVLMIMICISCTARGQRKTILCNDSSTYKLIDTSAVYHLIAIDGKSYWLNSRSDTVGVKSLKKGLKFYKNGRVVELNKKSGKDALEGAYCINNEKSEMIWKLKHVQAGKFLSREKLSIKNDTIIGEVLPSPQTKGYIKTYVKSKDY